jgi:hypothetical protein
MRRFSLFMMVWLLLSATALAQDAPKYEVYGGYSHLFGDISNTSFNLDGGEGVAVQNVNNWFGGMLDFGTQWGVRNGYNVNSQQIMYGPVFSYRKLSAFTPSAHFLLGAVRGSEGFAGLPKAATTFGTAFGGSVDIKINKMVSFRVLQGDLVVTDFMKEHQESLRVSTGLVFTFGSTR